MSAMLDSLLDGQRLADCLANERVMDFRPLHAHVDTNEDGRLFQYQPVELQGSSIHPPRPQVAVLQKETT